MAARTVLLDFAVTVHLSSVRVSASCNSKRRN